MQTMGHIIQEIDMHGPDAVVIDGDGLGRGWLIN